MNSAIVMSNRPKSLHALTSLRFLAAVVIVIHHSKGMFGLDSLWLQDLPTAQPVSFFFVMSGFIMAYVYPSLDSRKDISRFLLARLARIWPLHFATFLLVLIVLPSDLRNPSGHDSVAHILTNLMMVHSWIPIWNYYFSYNWLSWAVATEFAFYLVFPVLLKSWRRTWHIKLLLTFLTAAAIIHYANAARLPSGEAVGNWNQMGYSGLVYIGPLGRLFEFTLGMALALMYPWFAIVFHPGKVSGTIIESAVLALVVVVMFFCPSIHDISRNFPWIGESGGKWLVIGGGPGVFYGALILVMAAEKGMFSKLLARKSLRSLGEMSLSIFLLHQILIRYYQWRIENVTNLPEWLIYGYLWIVLLLGAYLLMMIVEHPCRQFILGLDRSGLKYTLVNRAVLSAGASLGLLLMVMIYYFNGTLTPKNAIDPTTAAKIIDNSDKRYHQVQFGKKFQLRSADFAESADNLKLRLIWESLESLHLKYTVAVHVLDADKEMLFHTDYSQNRGEILVPNHTNWLEETRLAKEQLQKAKCIGIVIYSGKASEVLHPDRGERDWNNQRLIIALPGKG